MGRHERALPTQAVLRRHATVTEDLELNLTLQEDSKISQELHHCDLPQGSATSVKS